jgi:prophage DNA circulation protein
VTWQEDLRRVSIDGRSLIGASFRGVTFFVETVERSGGRRAVVHEFPLRNSPFVEDLGRKAIGYRVDGYVLGDDYIAKRDALLDALDGAEGPGSLVLPDYGLLRAVCTNCTARYARDQGGIAMVSMEFAEAPTQTPIPAEVVDGPAQVADSSDAAIVAAKAELVDQYDASGMPAFALASAETALTSAAAALQAKLAGVISATQELAQFTGQVALITAEAAALVREPDALFDAFHAALTGLGETIEAAPGALMDALFEAYLADLGPTILPTTSTRQREADNQAALIGALRRVMAIEAARLAPLVAFASIDDAIAAREQVAAQLEEQAETAGDTAYPAIVDLRSKVLRAVPGSSEFARVVTVTRKVAIPLLVLTYQLYGSVDNEADIIARNSVQHPGFVFGELEVLSDV